MTAGSPVDALDAGTAWLVSALQGLDRRLAGALELACGSELAGLPNVPFQGLWIAESEVDELLQRPAAFSRLWTEPDLDDAPAEGSPLGRLVAAFALDEFEAGVLLLALAPEVDRRYERIFAFLQEDVTCRRPTAGLALDLLCPTPADRIARRAAFAPDAPLLAGRLLSLDDPDRPLLGRGLRLDPQARAQLLGEDALDERLVGWCDLVEPWELPDAWAVAPRLVSAAYEARDADRPLRIALTGPPSPAKRRVAASVARALEAPLLAADLRLAPGDARDALAVLTREAAVRRAVVFAEGVEPAALVDAPALLFLAREAMDPDAAPSGLGLVAVVLGPEPPERRRGAWRDALDRAGAVVSGAEIDTLAARFRLDVAQIDAAGAAVATHAVLAGRARPSFEDALEAAREQTRDRLSGLAQRVPARASWGDLVLPDAVVGQLRELCARVELADLVLDGWGMGALLRGRGVSALLAGGPGTGKTLAAEVVAGELGLDLFRVDLAGVVSKYIGETEKNLDRVFDAAERANAVILFDEAEALFGKRSEVRDSHDRYANLEIAYLLQKIEAFGGVALLATNLRQQLDDAFSRRLDFVIHLPFPEAADRERMWERAWPSGVALDGIEPAALGALPLTGAGIANAALAAAFLAAADGGVIVPVHVREALRREYQKLGKALGDDELDAALAGGALA